jgi:hypothetical protein
MGTIYRTFRTNTSRMRGQMAHRLPSDVRQFTSGVPEMIRNKARMAVQAAAVAGALLFTPLISHAQTADTTTTTTNYSTTNTGRHFNWGWLGLLGLLGLWPRGRKEVITTETRNTTPGNRF